MIDTVDCTDGKLSIDIIGCNKIVLRAIKDFKDCHNSKEFSREFLLSVPIDVEKVSSHLSNEGILTISAPKLNSL